MPPKPLVLAKKAPKVGMKTPVPRVAGGREPDAPMDANYTNQMSKLRQLGYERDEAEKIIGEQYNVTPPPAFAKGGLVGAKLPALPKLPKAPALPKTPKAASFKAPKISTSVKAPTVTKSKPAKVVK